jgi:hypothetical protein
MSLYFTPWSHTGQGQDRQSSGGWERIRTDYGRDRFLLLKTTISQGSRSQTENACLWGKSTYPVLDIVGEEL